MPAKQTAISVAAAPFFHSSLPSLPLLFRVCSFTFPCGHFQRNLCTPCNSDWCQQTTVMNRSMSLRFCNKHLNFLLSPVCFSYSISLAVGSTLRPPDVNSRPLLTGQLCTWLSLVVTSSVYWSPYLPLLLLVPKGPLDLPCSPPNVNSRPPPTSLTGQLCSWLSHALGKQLLTTDR